MQIWYFFKVSASEQIPLQHRKDGKKTCTGIKLFRMSRQLLEYKQATNVHGYLSH